MTALLQPIGDFGAPERIAVISDPSQTFQVGTLVAIKPSTGGARPVTADPTLIVAGLLQSSPVGVGSGAFTSPSSGQQESLSAWQGVFAMYNGAGADAITEAYGQPCYTPDGYTANATSDDGTIPIAGAVMQVDVQSGFIFVWVSLALNQLFAQASSGGDLQETQFRTVRLATAAALPSYTAAAGVLTASANGALTVDGVSPNVGDRILLTQGAAGADNGIYTLTQQGTASLPFILTRASDFITGLVFPALEVTPSEGSVFKDIIFQLVTTGAIVVGTTNLTFTPRPAATTSKLVHAARGVCTTNQSLSAFVGVTGGTPQDGITYVAGDVVLLAGQTTKSQNGLYVVGVVTADTAPLTRPATFFTGQSYPLGTLIEVIEGTLFGSTEWKVVLGALAAGTNNFVVDTTLIDLYPGRVTQQIALASSTATITNVPILSASQTSVVCSYVGANGGTTTSSIAYGPIVAPTAGSASGGSPSVVIDAIASGFTKNGTADTSKLNVTIINF